MRATDAILRDHVYIRTYYLQSTISSYYMKAFTCATSNHDSAGSVLRDIAKGEMLGFAGKGMESA